MKLFVETSEPVRYQRRLQRDVQERGRTPEGVLVQYERTVRPMHDLFVEPGRAHADRIIYGENVDSMQIPDEILQLK